MPRWSHVVVHHSLSADTELTNTVAIRRFHTSFRHYGDIITEEQYHELKAEDASGLSRPWKDIGYHWLIETLSDGIPTVIQGRDMMMHGAHCREQGMNRRGIGVCVIGDFDKVHPPEAVFEKAAFHVSWLCRMYRIPIENVRGHTYYATYKSCPGKLFDMDYFRERTEDYLQRWTPS